MADERPAAVLPVYMNQYEAKISILAARAQERRRRRQTSALVFLLFVVLSGLYLYSIVRDTNDIGGELGLGRRHWWQMLTLRRPWGHRRHPGSGRDRPHWMRPAENLALPPYNNNNGNNNDDNDEARANAIAINNQVDDRHSNQQHRSNATENTRICRNTQQGKWLVTDEQGVTCSWRALESGGCCATSAEHDNVVVAKEETAISLLEHIISGRDMVGVSFETAATSCLTCNDRECCGMYEFCVSCCMRPSQAHRTVGLFVTQDEPEAATIYTTPQLFEACTALCRTSSRSIRWNHTFKHEDHRHCYRVLSSQSVAVSAAEAAL